MNTIISTTIVHEGQSLEIFVKYDTEESTVTEIKSVFLNSHGMKIPVGDMFVNIPELDVAINKIIDRVDWREVYRSEQDYWYGVAV